MITSATFVQTLNAFPAQPAVFNPWRDIDSQFDVGAESPKIRAEQLRRYLEERSPGARFVICAEALR